MPVFTAPGRAWVRLAIVSCLLISASLLVATTAEAALSRTEVDELIKRKVDRSVLMSLVAKYCVDFEIDDGVRKGFGSRVDAELLNAMIACRSVAPRMAAETSAPAAGAAVPSALPRPTLPSPPPVAPGGVRYAVAPILVDGEIDLEATSLLYDRLREHVAPTQVVDPFTLGLHFGKTEGFHAGAPIDELLAAARAAGATEIVIAKAHTYKQFQDYGVRIEADLVTVDDGAEAWSDRGRGTSGNRSWSAAKKRAIIDLLRKLPTGS